jgi:hypothetical protein
MYFIFPQTSLGEAVSKREMVKCMIFIQVIYTRLMILDFTETYIVPIVRANCPNKGSD